MFEKILIANRGEIAVRIIHTARRLGIKSVAVYSEADTNALHVQMADEAYFIGQSPSVQSYLNIPNLMKALDESGADAVHPGYGFLSENDEFVQAVEARDVTFIGPGRKAVQLMGDKIESKKIAEQANVNTVPGETDAVREESAALEIAKRIGYPVMIKAAAGGGGKGMRVAHDDAELKDGLRAAASEAGSSFSDDRVFIEKFIEKPRHIEIQVLADKHGNTIALGERECSIQRRHQKVIEEAPSPFIDEATRSRMSEQAIALAEAVGYVSAGTVEFIVDKDMNFYFLEMNTRLQVEHRVTELITGLDLVEQMIRIAAGEKLSFSQEDVKFKGWAMEARVYAEDPTRGFLPSAGRITRYHEPESSGPQKVLIDSGVYEGGEVSMFYDPMVAKVCTHGATRDEAVEAMQATLGAYVIRGVSHNISFLEAILGHERFRAGDMSTNFISEEYPEGFEGAALTSETSQAFLATAVHIYLRDAERAAQVSGQLPDRDRAIGSRWVVTMEGENYSVYVRGREYGYDISYDNGVVSVRSSWSLGRRLFQGTVNGRHVSVKIEYLDEGFLLTHAGSSLRVVVRSPRVAELAKYMPTYEDKSKAQHVTAPIAGMVLAVKVKEGEQVKAGQELLQIEAMKMENTIRADHPAVVKKVTVSKGDSVAVDELLIEFEEDIAA